MKLQIETLTPPPAPAMGPAEAAALLAYLQTATDAHDPAVSSGERVLLCAAVAWLRALAVEPAGELSPFDGWTIGTWEGPWLWATKNGDRELVGAIVTTGWLAWSTNDVEPMSRGPETGQAGRDAVAAALRSRGAKL